MAEKCYVAQSKKDYDSFNSIQRFVFDYIYDFESRHFKQERAVEKINSWVKQVNKVFKTEYKASDLFFISEETIVVTPYTHKKSTSNFRPSKRRKLTDSESDLISYLLERSSLDEEYCVEEINGNNYIYDFIEDETLNLIDGMTLIYTSVKEELDDFNLSETETKLLNNLLNEFVKEYWYANN